MKIAMLALAVLLLTGCAHGRTLENLLMDEARGACVITNITEAYLVFTCPDGLWTVGIDLRVRPLQ